MKNFIVACFLFFSYPFFSQQFIGIDNGNYSGALGSDFNPANIADNRMKVDLFVGAGITGFNNYLFMNTSTMPSGWISSFTGENAIDTTWRSQPWFEKVIGFDSVEHYQNFCLLYTSPSPRDRG